MTYETIRYGSGGQNVRKLQTMLNQQGHRLAVDGRFGPQTRRAVTQYQRVKKLQPDGVVGRKTWGALLGGQAGDTVARKTSPVLSPVSSRERAAISMSSILPEEITAQPTSGYIPSQEVSDATDAVEELEASRPDAYQSQYDEELERLYDQILGRPGFSYDLGADPMYQQYRQQYMTQGRLAMEDTIGVAAGLTGGYGSSYSQNAGQQVYSRYLQGLNEAIPQIYALALDRYAQEGQALADQYAMVYDLEQRDRAQYSDDYDRWYQEYRQAQDNLDAIREEDYERYLDLLEAQEKATGSSGGSGSSGSSGSRKKSGSSGESKGSAGLSDFDLRELAFLYVDGGNTAGYGSASMLQWMRAQGIGQDMADRFYDLLRELGYTPAKSSGGGGGGNVENRDHRLN